MMKGIQVMTGLVINLVQITDNWIIVGYVWGGGGGVLWSPAGSYLCTVQVNLLNVDDSENAKAEN